jgi:sulfate-transporting ATPase
VATHILAFEDFGQVYFGEGNWQSYEEGRRARLGEDAARPHRLRYKPIAR